MRALFHLLFLICTALASAVQAGALEIKGIVLTVRDLPRAVAFYEDALGFEDISAQYRLDREPGRRAVLRLGAELIELEERPDASPIPTDSRAHDLWFQHFAIVVADMDRAFERVHDFGAAGISIAPQTIPIANVGAAGIRAYKFRDPDGHPLELLYFPAGKGHPRWQDTQNRLFLGIDHSAIAIADTERSLAFYRDRLGFAVDGAGVNEGGEQANLDGVPAPLVPITGLRARLPQGPGLEFLHYVRPEDARRPTPSIANGVAETRLIIATDEADSLCANLPALVARRPVLTHSHSPQKACLLEDPDSHRLLLVQQSP